MTARIIRTNNGPATKIVCGDFCIWGQKLQSLKIVCFVKTNMGPMGPRGLGPYVNIMDVLCTIKELY